MLVCVPKVVLSSPIYCLPVYDYLVCRVHGIITILLNYDLFNITWFQYISWRFWRSVHLFCIDRKYFERFYK